MQIHQTIFSIKELRNKVNNAFINGISNRTQKIQIIENWQKNISSGKYINAKEEEICPLFLTQFFGDILGYDYNNATDWNLRLENKTETDSTKSDAALGFFKFRNNHELPKDVRAVIEIKDARTPLDKPQNRKDFKGSPVEQAFMYAAKIGEKCNWVIVSNFLEIRLYLANDMTKYESFDILSLTDSYEFSRFYYILANGQLFHESLPSIIDTLLANRIEKEQTITKDFYEYYHNLRELFFYHLKTHNPDIEPLQLLECAQTIMDRIVFVSVVKDYDLLPYSLLKEIEDISTKSWNKLPEELWRQLKLFFWAIDEGLPPRIHKFNGGLFRQKDTIDNLKINNVFLKRLLSINNYDFESDLNINILGHIFEQSITDIEQLKNNILTNREIEYIETETEIELKIPNAKTNKRKKEGIFYTPEFITQYIVKTTVGAWLENKKNEIGLNEEDLTSAEFETPAKFQQYKQLQINLWEQYKAILRNIKILDPACGSGAFLTQAFDFLVREWQMVFDVITKLKGEKIELRANGIFSAAPTKMQETLSQIKKDIVNNNLFGVDLNSESVEITKLGLWLKSASKNDPLALLDRNIKCGNSLISDKSVTDKAFVWEEEFSNLYNPEKYYEISVPKYEQEIIDAKKVLNELIAERKKTYKERQLRSDLIDDKISQQRTHIHDLEYELKMLHQWNKSGKKPFEGFDVIVGNPPYVSANNMDFNIRQYFNQSAEYKTLSGKWDLFIPFIEKSLNILTAEGYFSFIVPYGFLNQPFAENLRKWILDEFSLQSITDLHEARIFEQATIPTCIPVIRKKNNLTQKVDIIQLADTNFYISHSIEIENFRKAEMTMFRTERLDEIGKILDKIKQKGVPLGDLFYVSTGAEIHGKEQRSENGELTSGYSKFDVLHTKQEFVFKPYIEGSDIPKSRELGRYSYPQIKLWLDYDNNFDRMRSPKFKELFESEKIIVRRSSGLLYILATIDKREIYTSEKCILLISKTNLPEGNSEYQEKTVYSIYFLLGIINSKLMNLFYGSVYGGFIDVYPSYLKALPISKNISTHQQTDLEQKVQDILKLHQSVSIKSSDFQTLIKSTFSIPKSTEKLINWFNLSWDDFTMEIKKSKGKITKKLELEFIRLFEEQKHELNNEMQRIKQIDKEIDRAVYNLYDLTEQEIEIIEKQ